MATPVCPACGYPTLKAALCAFCSPGEVFSGDRVFGTSSVVPRSMRGDGGLLVGQSFGWSGPVAS